MNSKYVVGKTYLIYDENYFFIPYHHKRHLDKFKSQWTVSLNAEASIFELSIRSNFIRQTPLIKKSFSFLLIENKLIPVGIDTQGRDSYISAFETSNNSCTGWHGYPVNHMSIRPSLFDNSVIDQWAGYGLPIHYVKKLKNGKRI